MNLPIKFDLFQNVYVKNLDLEGIVESIKISWSCQQYLIRYFYNGEPKSFWMLESDLELPKSFDSAIGLTNFQSVSSANADLKKILKNES